MIVEQHPIIVAVSVQRPLSAALVRPLGLEGEHIQGSFGPSRDEDFRIAVSIDVLDGGTAHRTLGIEDGGHGVGPLGRVVVGRALEDVHVAVVITG